jgi:uncharacterized LabA/DUF88 family protein
MALNIFPKREPKPAPITEPEVTLPEPSAEVIEDAEARKRPTRRGSRGGRGRGRAAGELQGEGGEELEAAEEPVAAPAPPKRASRARAAVAPVEPVEAVAAPVEADETIAPAAEPAPRGRRAPRSTATSAAAEPASKISGDGSTTAVLRAIEAQGRQIERLQEDIARRPGGGGGAMTSAPRVGIFVDAANIELACDRLRTRFDWRKILSMLTQDRQLVRAIAYSPVHDDPGVSIETQRFVEPFLDRGYKVVTKPLKRFADGSIKANVDIELALDVMEMLERLDIVVLASGDGDFQPLVELVQRKGIRVEVAAVGSSTASNLRHAADQFIDLQGRLRDIRA